MNTFSTKLNQRADLKFRHGLIAGLGLGYLASLIEGKFWIPNCEDSAEPIRYISLGNSQIRKKMNLWRNLHAYILKRYCIKKEKKRTKLSLINLLLGWNKWLYLHFGIIPFCFSVHFYNSASILSGVFRIFTLLSFVSKQKWINAIIVALYISLNYCFAEPTWNIKSVFVVVLTDDLRFYDLAGDQQLP